MIFSQLVELKSVINLGKGWVSKQGEVDGDLSWQMRGMRQMGELTKSCKLVYHRGMKKTKPFLSSVGPGLITGAADDDPSGIVTYTQAGAQFGKGVLWLSLFLLPLQIAVQEACARIGAVTGRGIAANIRKYYPRWVLYLAVGLLVAANTLNIGADLGAMAQALQLIWPVGFGFWLVFVFGVIVMAEIFLRYRIYTRVLKWLSLTIWVYPLTLFFAGHNDWDSLWQVSIYPRIEWSIDYLFIALGIAGTTISPYMLFWQAAEEIEEEKSMHLWHFGRPKIGERFIGQLRIDTILGMIGASLAAWSIMALATEVFFANGMHEIATAAQAASALEPLLGSSHNAGYVAKIFFASGVISLGMLAVPVLSGSSAYAVAEMFGMREGLNHKLKLAQGFYGVMGCSMLIGLIINYLGIDTIKALVYTAVINGIAAAPLLYLVGAMASDKKVMGQWSSGWISKLLIGVSVAIMGVGGVVILINWR